MLSAAEPPRRLKHLGRRLSYPAARTTRPTVSPCPAQCPVSWDDHDCRPSSSNAEHSYLRAVRQRVVIFDGAMGTNLQLADLTADDFGGPELEGCNELLVADPTRRRRPGPSIVLRRRLRRGGDRHVRSLLDRPRRVRPAAPGPGAQPGCGPAGPPSRRRLLHARPSSMGGRQHRPRHQVPHPGTDPLRRAARRLRGAGERPPRRWRRPDPDRDGVRPAPGQGGDQRRPPGHGRHRAGGPHPGPGDHRADRDHAPGDRDRGGAVRPRSDATWT